MKNLILKDGTTLALTDASTDRVLELGPLDSAKFSEAVSVLTDENLSAFRIDDEGFSYYTVSTCMWSEDKNVIFYTRPRTDSDALQERIVDLERLVQMSADKAAGYDILTGGEANG